MIMQARLFKCSLLKIKNFILKITFYKLQFLSGFYFTKFFILYSSRDTQDAILMKSGPILFNYYVILLNTIGSLFIIIISWVPQLVYKMKSFILEEKKKDKCKYSTRVEQNHQSYLDGEKCSTPKSSSQRKM